LEAQGQIDLKLRQSAAVGQHALLLEWNGVKAGIDLSDHNDRFMPELSDCDLYFKRCVRPEDLKSSNRIRPFGLNYACRSTRAMLRLIALFGPGDMVRRRNAWKRLFFVPLIAEFERSPAQPAPPSILFQARLWEPGDCPGDEKINEDRVRLLLALQSQFKERLAGGLAPTSYAKLHYPELLTRYPARQSRYVRWAREHLISVGFRGLFDSLGFKIGEALAASQCLIFEPTTCFLPGDAPLAGYRNIDECVAICDHFLSRPHDANQLRNQAWEYYRSEVEPGAHVEKLINSFK
jgi:hypothetical protein